MSNFIETLFIFSLLLGVPSADDHTQWNRVDAEFKRPLDSSKGEDGSNQLPPNSVLPWQLVPPLYPQQTKADGYSTARAFLKAAHPRCGWYATHVVGDANDAEKRLGHYHLPTDHHDAEHLTKQLLKFALDARQAIEQLEMDLIEAGINSSEDSDVAKILKSIFKASGKLQRINGDVTLRDIQNHYSAEKLRKFLESKGGRQNKLYKDEVSKIVSELLHRFQQDVLGTEKVPVEDIFKFLTEESPLSPGDFLPLFELDYLRDRLEQTSDKYSKSDMGTSRKKVAMNINDYFPLMLSWFFPKVNIIYYSRELRQWGSDLRDNRREKAGPFVFMYQVNGGEHWENLALHPVKGSLDEQLFNPDMAPHPALTKQATDGTQPLLLLPAPGGTHGEASSLGSKDRKQIVDDIVNLLKERPDTKAKTEISKPVHVADLSALRTPPTASYTNLGLFCYIMALLFLFVVGVVAVYFVLQWWQARNGRVDLFLETTKFRRRHY